MLSLSLSIAGLLYILFPMAIGSVQAQHFYGEDKDYTEVPTFNQLYTYILLRSNRIARITESSFSGLTNLYILNLQRNLIASDMIDSSAFQDLHRLRMLHLGDNLLTSLPPLADIADTLEKLYLSGNPITAIDDIPLCPLLTTFHITPFFTSLSDRIFVGFSSLTIINWANGSLNKTGNVFTSVSSTLTKLSLNDNDIKEIPDISTFTSLEEADLRKNLITSLRESDFPAADFSPPSGSLQVILDGNPLDCGRGLCWLKLQNRSWDITGSCKDGISLNKKTEADLCWCEYCAI